QRLCTYFLNKIQYNKIYKIYKIVYIKNNNTNKENTAEEKRRVDTTCVVLPCRAVARRIPNRSPPKYLPISRAAHPPFHSPFDPFRPPTNPSVSPLTSESSQSGFPQHG